MPLFLNALPVEAIEAAGPIARSLMGSTIAVARPLLGLSAVVAGLMLFKPLLAGILQAAILPFKPRRSLEQRVARHRFMGILQVNRLADHYSASQPNFASELRAMASRD